MLALAVTLSGKLLCMFAKRPRSRFIIIIIVMVKLSLSFLLYYCTSVYIKYVQLHIHDYLRIL